ncbi:hypothetical protein ACS0TY_004093 [Phlomoides rotata]
MQLESEKVCKRGKGTGESFKSCRLQEGYTTIKDLTAQRNYITSANEKSTSKRKQKGKKHIEIKKDPNMTRKENSNYFWNGKKSRTARCGISTVAADADIQITAPVNANESREAFISPPQILFPDEYRSLYYIVQMDDDVELDVLLVVLFGLIALMFSEINNCVLLMSYIFMNSRAPSRRRTVGQNDETCKDHIRMNTDCFNRLCYLLRNLGGLRDTRHVSISEQVSFFLTALSHHTKNYVIKHSFKRSGYTISKHFNSVLNTLLKLYTVLLVTPEPGCLGALDGTYIPVRVPHSDIPRYRNRKGNVSINVLAVCDHYMNFVFILSGWEGSAADSRVLRDALTRPYGLRVPNGCYYLCDGGYTNCNGFLAPYRGVRYHLKEWDDAIQPQNPQEYFNLKHARARNRIEHSFGTLKARWGILRSNSYYPIKTQNRFILGCCLLHNFIRKHMVVDPYEDEITKVVDEGSDGVDVVEGFIDQVEPSQAWTTMRDNLALQVFANYE